MDDAQRRGQAANHVRERSWSIGRALITVVVAAASVALLLWVAPPKSVIDQIGDMKLAWVIVAVGLELASCLSYVVVFRLFFPEPPRAVSYQVSWIAMGAGAVLPGGNISSAAATSWLLRRHGIGTGRLIGRCVALLCLLIGVGFFVNGVAGALLFAGVPGGPHDLLHTGGPILVSIVVLSLAALVVIATRRAGDRAPRAVRGFADGLESAWEAWRAASWRLLGAFGFLLFDMGALWAMCAATGHPIGFPAVVIAYCIGYLATSVPIPAGIGVLDSGLTAALVLYGLPTTAAVGAVLVYHAIAIWVPGLGGLIAWLPTRRLTAAEVPVVVLPELRPLRLAEAADTSD